MSMPVPQSSEFSIPDETVRVAHAAFPKGHPYITLRQELGVVYPNSQFAPLFSVRGQPAEAPGRLALVVVLQFAEGLTDRQAAVAVRGHVEWKYLLGLDLTDPGFDASVLSEFRARLLEGSAEMQLLDELLQRFKERGLLKSRRRQRTDSTHVLDAVRTLNRLELVGETLRAALNDLAIVIPHWLQAHVPRDWFVRYAQHFDSYRLPKDEAQRESLRLNIGADGYQLLRWLYAEAGCAALRQAPALEALRRIWLQQYYWQDEQVHWRTAGNLPPGELLIHSPYDLDTRYSTKGDLCWTGYKAILTETCAVDEPHFITHVQTTPATTPDVAVTEPIHQALAAKALLPDEHLLDSGFIDAELLLHSPRDYGLALVGPLPRDSSWQTRTAQGFDLSHFQIDWSAQRVTCPRGQPSRVWSLSHDRGHAVIHVQFAKDVCAACGSRPQCTQALSGPRTLKLRSSAEHAVIQAARAHQTTKEFKATYAKRAGVEGLISQGVRVSELRQSRYIGLAKTHLQHIAIAAAINLKRLVDWLSEPLAPRRRSARFAAIARAA